jgi:hypothetical protein
MRFYTLALVFLLLTVILPDLFFYLKLKKHRANPLLIILNFLPAAFFLVAFLVMKFTSDENYNPRTFNTYMWINFSYMLVYIPKLIYILFHFLNYLVNLFLKEKIYLIRYAGVLVAMFAIILMAHGAFVNPKNPQVRTVELAVEGLPEAFRGYKIVQISDIHLGSFGGRQSYLEPAVKLINEQDADIIVFTGDMVNNYQEEMRGWNPLFQQLESRVGKYAILGNHDYGDYSSWDNPAQKSANLDSVKQNIRDFGFTLLLNQHVDLVRDNDTIQLLGVENWGKPPFPKYGSLTKTLKGTKPGKPKILLSHDPSHWRGEILDYPEIALTLSGHTHAAQLAFNWYGKKVSPSSWMYKEWDGLYEDNGQYLYINRGLGFIGIPVRIGISRPEITVIQLIPAAKE